MSVGFLGLKKLILAITIFTIGTTGVIFGQFFDYKDIFQPGEVVTYKGYYNLGKVWLYAGDVEFSVKQAKYQGRQALHFQVVGNSQPSYDWIYKVRDKFQSYADPSAILPIWAERNTSENRYIAHETYTFTAGARRIPCTVENSDTPFYRDTVYSKESVFDLLTAIYYCRTIDFEKYSSNEKIPISVIVEGKVYPLYLKYIGKEDVKNHDNNKIYHCIKFSALVIEGTIFKAGENMFVWITDDMNRVPVKVEAKIIIGSVKAYLNTTSGLKSEMKAIAN